MSHADVTLPPVSGHNHRGKADDQTSHTHELTTKSTTNILLPRQSNRSRTQTRSAKRTDAKYCPDPPRPLYTNQTTVTQFSILRLSLTGPTQRQSSQTGAIGTGKSIRRRGGTWQRSLDPDPPPPPKDGGTSSSGGGFVPVPTRRRRGRRDTRANQTRSRPHPRLTRPQEVEGADGGRVGRFTQRNSAG